ncbi:MAG: hypothetical protein WBO04_01805 [Steroidobacteraceae bacterium]
MKLNPPGTITVGEVLTDLELMLADFSASLARDLSAIAMTEDEREIVLNHVDAAAEKAQAHFEAKIAAKLRGEH